MERKIAEKILGGIEFEDNRGPQNFYYKTGLIPNVSRVYVNGHRMVAAVNYKRGSIEAAKQKVKPMAKHAKGVMLAAIVHSKEGTYVCRITYMGTEPPAVKCEPI